MAGRAMTDDTPDAPQADAGRPDPVSTVSIPIQVSADYLARSLTRVLDELHPEPRLLYHEEDIALGNGVYAAIRVSRRGELRVHMASDAVEASLPVHLAIHLSWKPALHLLGSELGLPVPVELDADYTVHMHARPRLDPGYDLRLHATFDYQIDRPVGFERFGLSLSLAGATRSAAEDALHSLGDWMNSERFDYLNYRREVAEGWAALQQPVVLSSGHHLRLEIRPEGIHALPFHTQGDKGVIGLAATVRLRALAETAHAAEPVPLPAISPGEPPPGIALSLPLELPFDALEAALRENVADRPWHFDGRDITLRGAHLEGGADSELRARVDIDLKATGKGFDVAAHLLARGRPHLDTARQKLSLTDFEYDIETDSRLLNIAASLLRPFAGAVLEPLLSLPLEPLAERMLGEVNVRLAAGVPLAEDVTLHGRIEGVRLDAIAVNEQGLLLATTTRGTLAVEIASRAPGNTPA